MQRFDVVVQSADLESPCRVPAPSYLIPLTHDPSSLAREPTTVHTYRHLGLFLKHLRPLLDSWSYKRDEPSAPLPRLTASCRTTKSRCHT